MRTHVEAGHRVEELVADELAQHRKVSASAATSETITLLR